jgi:hypothetical protein
MSMAFFGAVTDTGVPQSLNEIAPDSFFLPPTMATGYGLPVAAT